jgi:hypothetical protein
MIFQPRWLRELPPGPGNDPHLTDIVCLRIVAGKMRRSDDRAA